jgi:hypothetical protein
MTMPLACSMADPLDGRWILARGFMAPRGSKEYAAGLGRGDRHLRERRRAAKANKLQGGKGFPRADASATTPSTIASPPGPSLRGGNVLGALRLPPPAVSLRIACPPAVLSVVVRHVARLLSPARSPFMRGRAFPIDETLKFKSDADAAHDPIPSQVSLSGQEEFSALDHHMKREARWSVRYRPILSARWRVPTPLAQWLPRFHSELRKCAV